MKQAEKSSYIIILICGVCCGPISTGYILGYSSPTLRDLSAVLTTIEKSMFASLLYIGGILGSVLVGYVMDKYGRRRSIMYSTVPAILGWLIIVVLHNRHPEVHGHIFDLYASRILGGISCGMNMACTTVYLIEIAPTEWRGTIASLNQVGITVGIFLSYAFGKYFLYNESAMIASIFAFVLFIAGIFIPESPRWLLRKEKSRSVKSSEKLRPQEYVVEEKSMVDDVPLVESDCDGALEPVSLLGMFAIKYRTKTLLVIQLLVLQQFTGINAFISYADILFASSIKDNTMIPNLPMTIGLVQIVFTLVATAFMDSYGRKSFLKVAGSTMALSMILLTASFMYQIEWLIMASMALYIVGFSLGWGPIPVISSTEIMPQEARGSAGSIAVLTSWIGGYVVTSTFPILKYNFGEASMFLLFALICVYAVFFVDRKLPETKGLSLESVAT